MSLIPLGILAGSGGKATSFESIATATGTGSASTVTFSSIPSTFQHLQIRAMMRTTASGNSRSSGGFYFNNDAGVSYAIHTLFGQVTVPGTATVGASGLASSAFFGQPNINNSVPNSGVTSNVMSVWIIDILDYKSTTKNKTVRVFQGFDNNGNTDGIVNLFSAVWLNTNAINQIDVNVSSGSLSTNSTIALYGIKG